MLSSKNTDLCCYFNDNDNFQRDFDNVQYKILYWRKIKFFITLFLFVLFITGYIISLIIISKKYYPVYKAAIIMTFLIICLFVLVKYLVFRLFLSITHKYNNLLDKMSSKKLLRNNIRFLYDEMKKSMEIINFGSDVIYVSMTVRKEKVNMNIKVRYNLFRSEMNRIDFFNEYIDIYLSEEVGNKVDCLKNTIVR